MSATTATTSSRRSTTTTQLQPTSGMRPRRAPLPTGPFASVATRPYDQQAYGDITLYSPTGYGRYNGVEVELQQRFSRGISYQIFWNVGNTLLVNQDTDDTQSIEAMPSINVFLPGAVPTDVEGTEPLPELQARSEYAEAPDPLELYRRITVRKREDLLRQLQRMGGQADWWLADCRYR